ncbi:MAG: photosynthetic reaction center subunit H [Rhodobacteraceae bacterium]|nr:photosynthetic reaction center subunit H [Paracoccaceae bacterium]
MVGVNFFGNVDLALIALYLFWIFLAGLIIYIQRENMREGYPLENDDGSPAPSNLPLPDPKTFVLPHGRGSVTVPGPDHGTRDVALESSGAGGFPFIPTGDPLKDGVGPASWAARRDVPELDAHGQPKIVPMSKLPAFRVTAGRDPRGLPVQAGDLRIAGTVSDMWVDVPEQMVRYIEVALPEGGHRLVPMAMARIRPGKVVVQALTADLFAGIPATRASDSVTLLEEDRISGYVAGGQMYAAGRRSKLADLLVG